MNKHINNTDAPYSTSHVIADAKKVINAAICGLSTAFELCDTVADLAREMRGLSETETQREIERISALAAVTAEFISNELKLREMDFSLLNGRHEVAKHA